MHILFLLMLGVIAGGITWLEWPSLVNMRMKAVFLVLVFFSYCMSAMITVIPRMPGPLQLWEHMVDPYISSWLPS